MDQSRIPNLTYKVELPGGQARLREASLYVMDRCKEMRHFGLTKLNKILWRADFEAFAARRGTPVTGRQYQRLKNGPAPFEMKPLLDEMVGQGYVRIEERPMGAYVEFRPVALVEASLRYFSPDDISYLDSAIAASEDLTGRQMSKSSHGIAWLTRENGDPMPYELALLSDDKLSERERDRFFALAEERCWHTD